MTIKRCGLATSGGLSTAGFGFFVADETSFCVQYSDGFGVTAEGTASPLRANKLDVIGVTLGWLTLYLGC